MLTWPRVNDVAFVPSDFYHIRNSKKSKKLESLDFRYSAQGLSA